MKKNTISKFFENLFSKIICCLSSKKTVSELDFYKSDERNSIDLLINILTNCWSRSLVLPLMIGAILMVGYAANAQNIQGVAPVATPLGGFAVDGNAFVKFTPTELGGDLFFERITPIPLATANPGGLFVPGYFSSPPANLGSGVFTKATNPEILLYPNTYLFRDEFLKDPTIFTSSNKINDNPKTYTWGPGTSPNKNEIQSAIAHFTKGTGDKSDDLWMLFAADRQVTNGSSYIDFEILQNTLTMTGTASGSGSFTSKGPNGGRTVGDILVTIEFTQGGGEANAVIRRWEANADNTGFLYNVYTAYVPGTILITNNNTETIVPYPIYSQKPLASGPFEGFYQYAKNQWAEGAVNISALFPLDPCFNISTLFVRTRTSGSSGQSELKDFPIRPIQLELDLNVNLAVTDPDPVCSPSKVDITGAASGCGTGYTLSYWANDDGTGAIDPTALETGTYYIKCTNDSNALCYDIKPVDVRVNPSPTADAGAAPTAQCPLDGGNDFTLSGSFTNGTALWTVKAGSATGTASGSVASGGTTASPTVHVDGIGSVTFVLTVTSDQTPSCGTAADEVTVTVKDKAGKPVVVYIAPKCDENTFSITVTGVINGAIYTVKDKNGNAIGGLSPASPKTASSTADITFNNIPAGSGYQVTVTNNGCVSLPNTCGVSTTKLITTKTEEVLTPVAANTTNSGFDAYPVPFKDQLTIKYKFDYVSDVKIEVFNSRGISVLSKKDSGSYLNKEITLNLHGNKEKEQVYIVKVSTDRETSTKKVISSR